MGKFSDLLRYHFDRGTGRVSPGQPSDLPWKAPQFATAVGCSARNVHNWMKGSTFPELRWLKPIGKAMYGTAPEFEEGRRELVAAREYDWTEEAKRFKAFGSKGLDPYSEHLMPADAVGCYETLFPDENERDQFEDIVHWVKRAREYDEDWKELLCTMEEEGRCTGFAFLSLHQPMGWWFGNYFGLLDTWREDGRPARFLKFIVGKCELIGPHAKGIIFEVERFQEQHIESVLARCDEKDSTTGWKPGETIPLKGKERYSIEAALRISLYTDYGLGGSADGETKRRRLPGALAVVKQEDDIVRLVDYVQPAMDWSLDLSDEAAVQKKEVELWLMIYPLEPLMKKIGSGVVAEIRHPLPSEDVDEIFTFLYGRVFPDAYGREERRGITGFREYCLKLRQKVEMGFTSRRLYLTNYGILSAKWERLLGRYGRRKLGIG